MEREIRHKYEKTYKINLHQPWVISKFELNLSIWFWLQVKYCGEIHAITGWLNFRRSSKSKWRELITSLRWYINSIYFVHLSDHSYFCFVSVFIVFQQNTLNGRQWNAQKNCSVKMHGYVHVSRVCRHRDIE